MWVQGCKDDYPHFIEEEIQDDPERRSHLPKVTGLQSARVGMSTQLHSLQLPACSQGQGCPSAWEKRSDLLVAGLSQSCAVSLAGAPLEVMGADVQTWSQDLPIKHQPATRKASRIPTPGAQVSPLKSRASSSPSQRYGGERAVQSHGVWQSH